MEQKLQEQTDAAYAAIQRGMLHNIHPDVLLARYQAYYQALTAEHQAIRATMRGLQPSMNQENYEHMDNRMTDMGLLEAEIRKGLAMVSRLGALRLRLDSLVPLDKACDKAYLSLCGERALPLIFGQAETEPSYTMTDAEKQVNPADLLQALGFAFESKINNKREADTLDEHIKRIELARKAVQAAEAAYEQASQNAAKPLEDVDAWNAAYDALESAEADLKAAQDQLAATEAEAEAFHDSLTQ